MKKALLFCLILICSVVSGQTQPSIYQVKGQSPVPIERYGARPGSGNLRTAILAAKAAGEKGVRLSMGTYSFSGGAIDIGPNFYIGGVTGSIVNCTGSVFESSTDVRGSTIENIAWIGDNTGTFFSYLGGSGLQDFRVHRCIVEHFALGFDLLTSWLGHIDACLVRFNGAGINANAAYGFKITNSTMGGNTGYGARIQGAAIEVSGCNIDWNTPGIIIANTTSGAITDTYFEHNASSSIQIGSGVASFLVSNCLIAAPADTIGVDTNTGDQTGAVTISSCFFSDRGVSVGGDVAFVDEILLINNRIGSAAAPNQPGISDIHIIGRSGESLWSGGTHLFSYNRYLGEAGEKSLLNVYNTGFEFHIITIASESSVVLDSSFAFDGWIEAIASGSIGIFQADNKTTPGTVRMSLVSAQSPNFIYNGSGSPSMVPNTFCFWIDTTNILLRNNYKTDETVLFRIFKRRN